MRPDGSALLRDILDVYAVEMGALPARIPQVRRALRTASQPWDAYRALAICLRSAGRYHQAAEAFVRAGELCPDPVLRWSHRLGAVDSYGQSGRYEQAFALAQEILDRLDPSVPQYWRARLALGNTLLLAGRDREAAQALAGTAERLDEPEASWARLARSSAMLFSGDPRVALDDARAIDMPEGSTVRGLAEINAAYAEVLLGRADAALITLEPWRNHPSLDEANRRRVALAMGDASLALGMPEAALAAFAEARDPARPLQNAHVALGEAAARRELGEDARRGLADAARRYRRLGERNWESVARSLLDQPGDARRLAESPYARTLAALCPSDPDPSGALRLIRRHGYGDLAWRAHLLRARTGGGLAAYRRMAEAILMERAARTTVAGRLAYLRDKEQGLAEYLGVLLQRPTPVRIEEARARIAELRAASLLDEAPSGPLGEALESLRARTFGADWPFDRRGAVSAETMPLVDLSPVRAALRALPARSDTAVYARVPKGYAELSGSGARRLPIAPDELRRRLAYLRYELLAPMADPQADPAPALRALSALGRDLGAPEAPGISAEGALWSVPWAALTGAELRLHPGLATDGYRLPERPQVAVWVGRDDGLSSAAAEISFLCALYPGAVVAKSAAEVRRLNGRFDLLCVVGHARRAANPMLSAVEFVDGPLFAAEIARLSASYDFAVLAACDTGALDGAAYEPNGLARALLARGARGVVASLWALDDAAALEFAHEFHPLISRLEPRLALETARDRVRAKRPHPYYWGALTLFAGKPA